MVHSHTVHLPLGALLIWGTVCGAGCLTPSLAALAAQVKKKSLDSGGWDAIHVVEARPRPQPRQLPDMAAS